MNIITAWTVLGKDWDSILQRIKSVPDQKDKILVIQDLLDEAKKIARKLMAENHPDKNPGNEESAKRFQMINEALKFIENDTELMKSRYMNRFNQSPIVVK